MDIGWGELNEIISDDFLFIIVCRLILLKYCIEGNMFDLCEIFNVDW